LSQSSAAGDAHEYPDTNAQYTASYLSSYLSTLSASLPPIDFSSLTPEEAVKAYEEYYAKKGEGEGAKAVGGGEDAEMTPEQYKAYKDYYDMYSAWAASASSFPPSSYDPAAVPDSSSSFAPYDPSTYSYYGSEYNGGSVSSSSFATAPGATSCTPLSSTSIFYNPSSSSSFAPSSSSASSSSSLFETAESTEPYYPFAENRKEGKREE
jgi:hypothetical protein